jgi:hypothetical protein
MNDQKQSFKHWCIVELFGHNKISGLCTEENIAGTNMLRVDVPETKKQPAFTKYYGSSAIYAINPVDEQTARIASENIGAGQVQEWNAETFIEKINASKPAIAAPLMDADFEDENEGYQTTDRSEGLPY